MKTAYVTGILFFLFLHNGYGQAINSADYRNFYGICWRGTPHENLLYARQMKYNYVFYQPGMEKDSLSNGFYFYLETPEYYTYDRVINTQRTYTDVQRKFYEKRVVLKDGSKKFPDNMANGWNFNSNTFAAILDFQQQKVIDGTVDSILSIVKNIEQKNPKFHFGGYAWDVPQPAGDFWNANKQVTLSAWTGGDSEPDREGVSRDYKTYSEGHIAFYNQLLKRTKAIYKNVHFIVEPYKVYEEWAGPVKNSKLLLAMPADIVSQEGHNTAFVDDARIFDGTGIKKENMACTSPDVFGVTDNLQLAAKAATNGMLFAWYGRFGGTGDMPNFKSITEVPPRLKLIRVLSDWENRNGTPLITRTWDGSVYKSANAFASTALIWVLQPKTQKLFFVPLTMDARLVIPAGKKIVSISNTDGFFMETSISSDFSVQNNVIKPKDELALNNGYIVKIR